MSHDRGCFKCHEDRWNYKYCQRADCPNKEEKMAMGSSGGGYAGPGGSSGGGGGGGPAGPGLTVRGPTLRKPLEDFAWLMEEKLRKNDHKKGWRELPIEALFKLLMIEIEEFKVAHDFFGPGEAQNELVDIANFAMMLHDRLGQEKK